MAGELPEIDLVLTPYQAEETGYGMEIDEASDYGGCWGRFYQRGKTWHLVVFGAQHARDAALYRITSQRDIALDNAGSSMATAAERRTDRAHGRSLDSLTRKLVEACGGPGGFSESVRRWITY